jgi:hypothetical protein
MTRKTELLTARVTPEFKQALRLAAAREHRSQANLLEVLVYRYCQESGLDIATPLRPAPDPTRAARPDARGGRPR